MTNSNDNIMKQYYEPQGYLHQIQFMYRLKMCQRLYAPSALIKQKEKHAFFFFRILTRHIS